MVGTFTDHAISGSTTLRPGYQSLLQAMRSGRIDLVLSESLDRLSRDQEHVAGFHKAAQFAGVRILTLSEGEISELHVGLKGTMGALYLKDLADKTRRGLEGRVREGRSGGGLSYGYRVIRGPIDRNGEAERGLRQIDLTQAAVVRRIFEEFAKGRSPIALVRQFNAEELPGPRGGLWSAGALRGQAGRETGILRNRLYIGELVWNRRRWLKDPTTSRRVARANDQTALVTEQVPELRIIDQPLWDQVQARLQKSSRPECGPDPRVAPDHLWHHRRPRHLLTGKLFCGACGGSYTPTGRDYLGCQTVRQGGKCKNKTTVRRSQTEMRVLQALEQGLMQPDLVAVFVAEFTTEWNRLRTEASAGLSGIRAELATVERQLQGLIDMMIDGFRAPGLQARLDQFEARKSALVAALTAGEESSSLPRLHGSLAEAYRLRVHSLREAFSAYGDTEILEALKALVDRVLVYPSTTGAPAPLELIGHLSALLQASGASAEQTAGLSLITGHEKTPRAEAHGVCSGSWDAGTGFEPVTFRL
ncbi:recombinase family protein [Falsiroseomonas sp.]|uniref:recombinase family protein n=1 Tax=Falsiroseomonas sp. TaxID=2870721 RepID=UPI003525BE82